MKIRRKRGGNGTPLLNPVKRLSVTCDTAKTAQEKSPSHPLLLRKGKMCPTSQLGKINYKEEKRRQARSVSGVPPEGVKNTLKSFDPSDGFVPKPLLLININKTRMVVTHILVPSPENHLIRKNQLKWFSGYFFSLRTII